MDKWFFLFFMGILSSGYAQTSGDQEISYVIDYSDQLLLRLYTVTKFNSLSIVDKDETSTLKLLPNGQTNLGIGFNYKGFGLGVAFGLPKPKRSNEKYGTTQRLDIQGSIYGRKFGGDGFLQIYKGYYNSNPNDFVEWNNENSPQVPSLQILTLGVTGFFFFNDEKFSYRAAFVRDEVQNKSAGSFIMGFFGNYDASDTNAGYIPQEFPDSLQSQIDLKAFQALAVGVSVGYAYTFVKNKFFLSVAGIPGFGYQNVQISRLNGQEDKDDQPARQILFRISMGYEHPKFFLGLFGSTNLRNLDIKEYDLRLATEQIRFVVGKRFNMGSNN